jgi:hypothetical protein
MYGLHCFDRIFHLFPTPQARYRMEITVATMTPPRGFPHGSGAYFGLNPAAATLFAIASAPVFLRRRDDIARRPGVFWLFVI